MAPKATRFFLDSSSSAVYHGVHAESFSSVSSVSLDGYVARSNGAVDFLFIPRTTRRLPLRRRRDCDHGTPEFCLRFEDERGKLTNSTMTMYVFTNSKAMRRT